MVQHAAAGTRANISRQARKPPSGLETSCCWGGDTEFPKWTKSLGAMLLSFEDWLERAFGDELTELSVRERGSFRGPSPQSAETGFWGAATNSATGYRSARCGRSAFPLRTTETEIAVAEPAAPKYTEVGRVFDRNWELLSPILPVWVLGACAAAGFEHTIRDKVYQNLSRLRLTVGRGHQRSVVAR